MSDFLILHTLRVKGLTPLAVVSAQTGLPATQADEILRRLAARGLVTRREGRMAGALLTPAGKQAHAEQLARDPGTRGAAAALAAAYEEFLPVNGDFKRICQSWQMRPGGQPNDHGRRLRRRGNLAAGRNPPTAPGLRPGTAREGTAPVRRLPCEALRGPGPRARR